MKKICCLVPNLKNFRSKLLKNMVNIKAKQKLCNIILHELLSGTETNFKTSQKLSVGSEIKGTLVCSFVLAI